MLLNPGEMSDPSQLQIQRFLILAREAGHLICHMHVEPMNYSQSNKHDLVTNMLIHLLCSKKLKLLL